MRYLSAPAVVVALAAVVACVSSSESLGGERVSEVVPNDNRAAAGVRRGDTLTLELVATRSRWHPAAETDSSVLVGAFAEEGKPPTIPGPLVRVALGTPVFIAVRNALSDTIALCPLWIIRCERDGAVLIAPGALGAWSFAANRWGATLYRAGVLRADTIYHAMFGTLLSGALVVDSAAGVPSNERVFVINTWNHPADSDRFVQTLNGKTWPHTERIALTVGDSVRWRLLNAGRTEHPMHLHGFYFRVDSRGDLSADTLYSAGQRELAVTENLRDWGVATISWAPSRGGNWLFHCHKTAHMSGEQHDALAGRPPGSGAVHMDAQSHLARNMGGLILGLEVKGDPKADSPATNSALAPLRRIRLRMVEKPRFYRGVSSAYAFVLEDSARSLRSAALDVPGPLLLLRRNDPVEIVVTNALTKATTVHWHGIELESYYDGVAGWSGVTGSLTPMIAPSDSFVARFTPPRSGTFMYHAHVDETLQLNSGLYAPIVVLDASERWDPSRDHVLLFSQGGPDDEALVLVNGKMPADTLHLASAAVHRLRLVNITSMDEVSGELMADSTVQSWRVVAKDGAALPARGTAPRPARFHLGPGEILDVAITPTAGMYSLRIDTFNDFVIPIKVR